VTISDYYNVISAYLNIAATQKLIWKKTTLTTIIITNFQDP